MNDGYYDSFLAEFKEDLNIIKEKISTFDSVYEVGCGSGVNLFLYRELCGITKLGGCDYSKSLIDIANRIIVSNDIVCEEALNIDIANTYDIVISDSVFQYFQDDDYGYKVLEKMYKKANKMVIIKEIHNINMKEEHLEMRRKSIENYDEKYKGLDKTFYLPSRFIKFAKDMDCQYIIKKPKNNSYWNNDYVFDFYLIK